MKKLAIIAAAALLLASCTKEDDRYAAEVYTYIVDGERQMRYPLYCLVRLYDTKDLSKTDFYTGKAVINPHFVLKERERIPVMLPGTDSVQTITVYDTIRPFTSMESYATGKEGYVIFNDLPEREYIGIIHNRIDRNIFFLILFIDQFELINISITIVFSCRKITLSSIIEPTCWKSILISIAIASEIRSRILWHISILMLHILFITSLLIFFRFLCIIQWISFQIRSNLTSFVISF